MKVFYRGRVGDYLSVWHDVFEQKYLLGKLWWVNKQLNDFESRKRLDQKKVGQHWKLKKPVVEQQLQLYSGPDDHISLVDFGKLDQGQLHFQHFEKRCPKTIVEGWKWIMASGMNILELIFDSFCGLSQASFC